MNHFVLWRFYDCNTPQEALNHLEEFKKRNQSNDIQFEGPFLYHSDFRQIPKSEDKVVMLAEQFKQRHYYPILLMKSNLTDAALELAIFNQRDDINSWFKIESLEDYNRLIQLYKVENNSKEILSFWKNKITHYIFH